MSCKNRTEYVIPLLNKPFSRRGLFGLGMKTLPWAVMPQQVLRAQTTTPQRFVMFFLAGGWDTALAIDPVVGGKVGNYQTSYNNTESTVSGKSNLVIGQGLTNASSAFSNMNTAFVNGMYVEVTAHELATKYLMSGRSTLSRSREFPAVAALLGDASSNFPPHLVLGQTVPLGDTKETNPPLHAISSDQLTLMLAGPRGQDFSFNDSAITTMHGLVDSLNTIRDSSLSTGARNEMTAWRSAQSGIGSLYDAGYYSTVALDTETSTRYNVGDNWQVEAHAAMAFKALQSGMASYVTVHGGSYDTHSSHLSTHLPEMSSFATTLNTFVNDLRSTADPTDTSLSLADTTTIVVTSEFTRTPTFNNANGTDHWPSASAIIMGPNVSDNTVVGATDNTGLALGWSSGTSATRTTDNELNAGHLYSAILRHFGYGSSADSISVSYLSELFTT